MTFDTFRELLGFCVGILYLWWEYHADSKVWIASVIMPMISMWIYFSKGLYADFAINIYYLAIAVYGFIAWTRAPRKETSASPGLNSDAGYGETHVPVNNDDSGNGVTGGNNKKDDEGGRKITRTPLKVWLGATAAALVLWYAIWWALVSFTDSTVPVADSFTTALSIVGLWMLARKYAEQWLVWFVVDIVCSALYYYKGLPFYCALYAVYTVIALLGYRKWLRLMHTAPSRP